MTSRRKTGLRNTPTLVNRAYGRSHFFDGRAATLEEQALQPIEDPDELAADLGLVIERLRGDAETTRRFRSAFEREVDPEDLGRALAAYLRTILAGDAPVDRYQAGDLEALDDEQLAGLRLFRGKAGCARCHLGPNLTDEAFHVTGVAWRSGILEDPGRFAVSGEDEDRGAFKTPTLREIARTAPYMHDGSVGTLEDVVELYDRGGVAIPTWIGMCELSG